jgi:hypothetical protein
MNRVIRWNPTRELDLFNEFDRMLERTWDGPQRQHHWLWPGCRYG